MLKILILFSWMLSSVRTKGTSFKLIIIRNVKLWRGRCFIKVWEFCKIFHVLYLKSGLVQYVVLAHWMLCCPVGYVEKGGLTSRDMLNSSENYLLLGFLLVRLVQTFLLLVRQPITQDNCSISVSYRSFINVTCLENLLTLKIKMKLFRRVELGQETI